MTEWDKNRAALRWHLENNPIDNFLEWSTVRKTMYVGSGAAQQPHQYETLKRDWDKWGPVVKWFGFGAEAYHDNNGYASDPNLIQQAYHLARWLSRTRQDITRMRSIIEFGAGYGAMALICYRLGFKGLYYIIDLPEPITLQKYYLSATLPEQWSKVFWLQSQPLSNMSADLLIACFSLSETPIEDRERLLSTVTAKEMLFASDYEFEGVDNQRWFKELGGTAGYDWLFEPHGENAFYMTGVEL
jgi:hypothetical protein